MDNIFECDAPRSKGRKQGLINTRLIIYILGVLVLSQSEDYGPLSVADLYRPDAGGNDSADVWRDEPV